MTEPENLDFVVHLYPDPVLRRVAQPVQAFDEGLARTVAAMFARMYASKGVGLAAPQVGLPLRILVLDPGGDPADRSQALVLVNPEITARAGPVTLLDEGCLSFPGIFAEVRRPERCTVRAWDLEGCASEREYAGFASRIIQHEYDHLEGILLVDRMSPADRQMHRAALAEMVADWQAQQRRAASQR